MTVQEIRKQINMQKIHDARTKQAMNNLKDTEKFLVKYNGWKLRIKYILK